MFCKQRGCLTGRFLHGQDSWCHELTLLMRACRKLAAVHAQRCMPSRSGRECRRRLPSLRSRKKLSW